MHDRHTRMSATGAIASRPRTVCAVGMSDGRSQSWVLYGLIAANVAMFGVEVAAGASPIGPSPQQMIELGGSYPPLTLGGEWWRLGSSLFLHFGILHLALNMLCLYQARAVEPAFGRVGFLVIYLLAGLGGGIASLIASSGNVVSAGASGCVFGVYGAFGAKLVLHRDRFEPEAWMGTMRRLGTFLVLNMVVGLTTAGISVSAHVGGFIVGAALGAALLAGAGAEQARMRRALGFAALGVALTAVAVMTIKADAGTPPVLQRFLAVEQASTTKHNAALERYKAGEIEEAELTELVDREVVAPYRQVHQELRATTDVPARLRPLFARIDELMTARLASWDSFQATLREQDPAKQAALVEAYDRGATEVAKRLEAVGAEIERLKE